MSYIVDLLGTALLGRYEVERELGRGGMATVLLAEDLKHHRKVAIKVLHPELAAYVGPNRFLREIEIAAGLQHPHILPLIDSGQAGDLPYYVTPFVTGETLRERLTREGRLLMGDALWLAWEVADALDYAHAHGVIHRDIKPENILLSRQHAVVADFGIAKAAGAAEERSETAGGVVLGSPGYMSPEQAAGRPVIEAQTDIFSLGVVLYEMLCGVLPFSGAAVAASMGRALPAPPPPRSHREDVPPWLEDVMLKALASDPSDRFATASELAAALHPATGARPTPTRTMSPVQPGRVARSAVTTPASGAPDTTAARSIAVLPFENVSPDPEDAYFSDGITEEIINVLTRVPGLQVAARTSSFVFRGTQMNIRTVCERLNVRTALEGSVRRAGNRIRITAQLIDAGTGFHLWAERYDRVLHDVFAIQEEIATAIGDELKIKLRDIAVHPLARHATDNIEAFELYLRGRHSWNERGLAPVQRALASFRAAVERDPAYAPAYAGIADCYFVLTHWGYLAPREGYREAKRAAQRAIELDDSLAEGRVSLASVTFCLDWDWPLAEREFLRAIELEPRLANARYSYSVCLAACGRFDEAVAQGREACRLDPLNRQVASVLGRAYYLARRYGEAVDAMRQSLTLTPDIASTHMWLALSLVELERDAEALSEAAMALHLAPSSPTCIALHGYVAGRVGDRQSAEKALTRLRGQTLPVAFSLGEVCLGLGNEEEALEWLRKSIDEREDGLVTYGLAPIFDSVRTDPRFTALWERVGMSAVAPTPVARPPDRLPSAVSDRYRIERELGRGGNGVVYLAHDLKYDRKVALKVLPPDLALAVRSGRFLREIQIAAKLSHPHILPLYDSGEAPLEREGPPILFYVMPHVEGESLRERLKRETQLALGDAVAITRDVASALDHAHAQGVVHRDIKPENILLSHGKPIVMDFGIARALTSAGGATLTDAGIAVGTPAYMSPEQSAASSALDARADVYSLGCMVYEMLAGHAPFGGANAQELLARHNLDPVPSLRAARPDCSPAVEQTLSKALAKVPAARFRSAGEFAQALEQAVGESHRFGRRLLRWVLVALAALAALALVLWLA